MAFSMTAARRARESSSAPTPRASAETPAVSGTPSVAVSSPFLDARKHWDERYGDLIARARNWRIAAFLALGVSLMAVGGLIALSLRSRVVPFVVAVDSLGRVVAAGPAEQASVVDDKLKRAALNSWVGELRTVTTDGVAQRKMIDRVYAMVGSGTPAQVQVSDFYRNDPPFQRAKTQTVEVEVEAIFPTTETTYIVEWTETTRTLAGQVQNTQRWKGAFTIAQNPPTEESLLRVNPLGVYVTQIGWSRVMKEQK